LDFPLSSEGQLLKLPLREVAKNNSELSSTNSGKIRLEYFIKD
jgi:hypothetical protein